ncbi:MAG: fibronectin type III domain-containing protein, partial [Acidimicrobiia bacterium]|nr:fibronectin type III domain-containing protein [Acidimicrobiia bacterium]
FPRDGIPDLEPPSLVSGIHATAASATSIEVSWTPATDDVGINGYVVRRDGVVVATVPSAVFLDEGLTPRTDYEYTVEALDSVNRSGGISSPVVLETWARVLEADAPWMYLDSGPPGRAWLDRGFDDSSWEAGHAQLGFGDNDEATDIEKGEFAYYFRSEFRTPNGREVLDASIRLIRDDGAVVYLNGVEVMRSNMPSGPIAHNTPAASTTGGSEEDRWFTESVDPSLFTPGINVLAVEVHQRTENSSDVSFALGLDAELSDEPFDTSPPSAPKNLTVETKSASSLALEWRAASDDRGIDGYIVKRNGTKVGYSDGLTFVDTNLAPNTTYRYKVIAVDTSLNEGPPSLSRNGTTLADTSPPSKPTKLRVAKATGTSLKIKWQHARDQVGVSHYVVKADGNRIGTTSGRSFVLRGLEPDTEYHITVAAVDTSGNRGAARHIRQETEPYFVRRTAVAAGSHWRFLDDGSDQAGAWRERTFDARQWPRGEAELGYGDGDEVTIIDGGPGNDRHIATYFRRKFRIADVGAVQQVRMSIVRDDGVVVYLNGIEIFRDNMPSGEIGYDTKALESVAGDAESEWVTVEVPANALRNGFNALAVEIHQSGQRSSDTSFDLELILNPHLL